MSLSVLQLANKGINPPDGGTMGITLFTRELARLGHQVTLLALTTEKHNNPNIFPESLAEHIQLISVPVKTNPSIGSLFIHFCGRRERAYMAKRFYHLAVKQQLIEHLKAYKYDIIQLEGPYMGLYLPTIQKYSDAIVILRAHNLEFRIWERKAQMASGLTKALYKTISKELKAFEQNLFTQCEGILPITQVDAREIASLAPDVPQMVIPFCTDFTKKQITRKPLRRNGIGYLGALDWQPNIEGLYWFIQKVWPLLRHQNPNITLQIAGRNASKRLQQDLSNAIGVEFLGEIPNAEIFLTQQSALVVPLWSGSGIRVKIIEGMSLGLPMVVTSMALEGIEAIDGEQLLVANTPEDFAAKINTLLSNRQQAAILGLKAQEFTYHQFNPEKWFPELIQFYQNLAAHD